MTKGQAEKQKAIRILAHAASIIGLYLVFSFVLFLGLQVNPVYGNIGLVAVGVLVALYLWPVSVTPSAANTGTSTTRPASRTRRCNPSRNTTPYRSSVKGRRRTHRLYGLLRRSTGAVAPRGVDGAEGSGLAARRADERPAGKATPRHCSPNFVESLTFGLDRFREVRSFGPIHSFVTIIEPNSR